VGLELETASKVYALEAVYILVGRAGIEPTTNGLKVSKLCLTVVNVRVVAGLT